MMGEPELRPRRTASRTGGLGVWSLVVAAALVGLEVLAIVLGSSGQWWLATVLAWTVIVLTAASFLLALLAIVLGRGRVWAFAGAILSVLANPLVQLWLLGIAGSS